MELLKTLYKIYALTGSEWPMIQFVVDYLGSHVKDCKVQIDSWGNLYIERSRSLKLEKVKSLDTERKNNPLNSKPLTFDESEYEGYPTLCCHLDQAQKTRSEDFTVIEKDGLLTGYSPSRNASEGLGADDKNGIWVCLKVLEECEHLKVFMSVGEEKGCWGSNRADLTFFKDSLYILEPDCKGGEEIRTLLRGIPVASKEFEEALETEKFGYVITEGKTSDILPLTLSGVGVSCANIPCGYHNPHKDDEYCNIKELNKCVEFILHTVQNLHTRFSHQYKTETQKWVLNRASSKFRSLENEK